MPAGTWVEVGIQINAPINQVWDALVDPEKLDQWLNRGEVELNWAVGETSVFSQRLENDEMGGCVRILKMERWRRLQYICSRGFSSVTDRYEDFSTVILELEVKRSETYLHVKHLHQLAPLMHQPAKFHWSTMLIALKNLVERGSAQAGKARRKNLTPAWA